MSEEIKFSMNSQEGNSRPDYTEELITLLRSRRPVAQLREEMENYHDSDLADLLELLSNVDRRRLYRILGLDRTGDVFSSSLMGALTKGADMESALKTAVDFTVESIKLTVGDDFHKYGVKFEKCLSMLTK